MMHSYKIQTNNKAQILKWVKDKTFQPLRKFLRLLLVVPVTLLFLSACTGMNAKFGCDATAGSGCTPVSRVNAKAESGYFDQFLIENKSQDSGAKKTLYKSIDKAIERNQAIKFALADNPSQLKKAQWFSQFRIPDKQRLFKKQLTSQSDKPCRSAEHIQRVWIAPYEDAHHNYHAASNVFVVLDKPHWVNTSPCATGSKNEE